MFSGGIEGGQWHEMELYEEGLHLWIVEKLARSGLIDNSWSYLNLELLAFCDNSKKCNVMLNKVPAKDI